MGFIQGGFAKLDGKRIGSFTVTGLMQRDRQGIPRWEVCCDYGHTQVLGHLRLAALIESKAANNLQCSDPGCPLSKSRSQSETLTEFLRRERREADRQAQAEADQKKAAYAEAAKQIAQQKERERLQLQFREFWLHQLKADVPESEIPNLKRWTGFSERARQTIIESCRRDPGAKWTFTK